MEGGEFELEHNYSFVIRSLLILLVIYLLTYFGYDNNISNTRKKIYRKKLSKEGFKISKRWLKEKIPENKVARC